MRQYILASLIAALLLTGCAQEQKYMLVLQYDCSDGDTIVYDQNHTNYVLKNGVYVSTPRVDIDQTPALKYYEVREDYSISQNFVGNYSCTPLDAFSFITHLRDNGYSIKYYEYKPYLCTMWLTKDDNNYKFFVEEDTTRIYTWDSNGKTFEPEGLVANAEDRSS